MSGSTTNERNITVHVGLDTDTLKVLNQERFNNRTDLYYQVLPKNSTHSETVQINAGQDVALMPIDFQWRASTYQTNGITIDYRRIT